MVSPAKENPQDEIQDLISKINQAWLGGRIGELHEYFHNDMVNQRPRFHQNGKGQGSLREKLRRLYSEVAGAEFHRLGTAG